MTIAEKCRQAGISVGTYYSRIYRGWENPLEPKPSETIAQQCKKAGISLSSYYTRLRKGWENPLQPIKLKERFVSEENKALLKKHGISRGTYFARLRIGWSEFEATHVATSAEVYKINGKSVRSQLKGYKYSYFVKLVNDGLSVEDAFNKVTKGAKK